MNTFSLRRLHWKCRAKMLLGKIGANDSVFFAANNHLHYVNYVGHFSVTLTHCLWPCTNLSRNNQIEIKRGLFPTMKAGDELFCCRSIIERRQIFLSVSHLICKCKYFVLMCVCWGCFNLKRRNLTPSAWALQRACSGMHSLYAVRIWWLILTWLGLHMLMDFPEISPFL